MDLLITAQGVAAAAEAIAGRGAKPSVRKVRDELGGGSPNDILRLLNLWKDRQRQPQAAQPETPPKPVDVAVPAMPPEICQTMEGLSSLILATINTLVGRERSQAAAAQQAIQAAADCKVELARVEVDQKMAEAKEAEATDLKRQAERLTGTLRQTEATRDALAEDLSAAKAVAADQADSIKALRATLAQANAAASAHAEAASKLEKRVDELEDERRRFQQQAAADRQAADIRDAALHERWEAAEQDRRQQSAEHAQERAAARERELSLHGQIEQAAQRERDTLKMAAVAEAEVAGWRNKAEAQAEEIARLSSLRWSNRTTPKN